MIGPPNAKGRRVVHVSGFAVAAHGYQRATKDTDIFVRPTLENARRVIAARRIELQAGGWAA
jgi:hypothetical protein